MTYLMGGLLLGSGLLGLLWLAVHRVLDKRQRETGHRRPRFSVEQPFAGWSSGGDDGGGCGGESGGGD